MRLAASLSSLDGLISQLSQWVQPLHIATDVRYALELALTEAFSNIVRHGVCCRADQFIDIDYRYEAGRLTMTLRDRGRAIPAELLRDSDGPFPFPDPEDMASWPEGGMGLMMIRASVDEMTYRVDGGMNTLTLIKHL